MDRMLQRLFGVSKSATAVMIAQTPEEALAEHLQQIVAEVARIEAAARTNHALAAQYAQQQPQKRTLAAKYLKHAKRLDQAAEHAHDVLLAVNSARQQRALGRLNQHAAAALRQVSQEMQAAAEKLSADDVRQLQEDLADTGAHMAQVTEALGRLGAADEEELDEDALEEELEALAAPPPPAPRQQQQQAKKPAAPSVLLA
jgi:hypothetical protein